MISMTFRSALTLSSAAFLAIALLAGTAMATSLADIKARGELVIGVKDASPPFGFRAPDGHLTGMEVDLASDLANRLGVKLSLFAVSATARMQFLELGKIDAVIATLAVTPYRKQQAALIEPFYYAGDPAVMVRKGSASIADLNGKEVCTFTDAYYNGDVSARAPGARLVTYRGAEDATRALSAGRCAAFALETAALIELKRSAPDRWADYDVLPVGGTPLPWAIAVRQDEAAADLRKFMSDAVADWHRTGKLIELEKKWVGQNTPWVVQMHEKFK
jgi:polar amino acid transport system substrate-binding protein